MVVKNGDESLVSNPQNSTFKKAPCSFRSPTLPDLFGGAQRIDLRGDIEEHPTKKMRPKQDCPPHNGKI